MDKEIKDKWVKLLRSGKVRQTTGRLKDTSTGGFCCLGVLQDKVLKLPYNPDHGVLTPSATRACKLPKKIQHDLAELNDNGMKFRDIASVIEVMVP